MDTVHYRGAYRFTDRAALDHALAIALAGHDDWRPRFDVRGAALRIDLDLPARSEAHSQAAHVMQTLANHAVEGIVVARRRELAVDVFVCGE